MVLRSERVICGGTGGPLPAPLGGGRRLNARSQGAPDLRPVNMTDGHFTNGAFPGPWPHRHKQGLVALSASVCPHLRWNHNAPLRRSRALLGSACCVPFVLAQDTEDNHGGGQGHGQCSGNSWTSVLFCLFCCFVLCSCGFWSSTITNYFPPHVTSMRPILLVLHHGLVSLD